MVGAGVRTCCKACTPPGKRSGWECGRAWPSCGACRRGGPGWEACLWRTRSMSATWARCGRCRRLAGRVCLGGAGGGGVRVKVVLLVVHPSCAHCSPVRHCCVEMFQFVTYAAIPPGSRRTCCRTCRRRPACRPWCRLVPVSFSAGGSRRRARCGRTDVLSIRGSGGLAVVAGEEGDALSGAARETNVELVPVFL